MEILTMRCVLIEIHLSSGNNVLDQLRALLIRSTRITVAMHTKNRHRGIFSQSDEFIVEISFSNNMGASLDSQSIGGFDNLLVLAQCLR